MALNPFAGKGLCEHARMIGMPTARQGYNKGNNIALGTFLFRYPHTTAHCFLINPDGKTESVVPSALVALCNNCRGYASLHHLPILCLTFSAIYAMCYIITIINVFQY